MSMLPEITDSQKEQLAEFRSRFGDEITGEMYDDYFFLRWLRARKWNLDAAENMLRTSMKNRAMVNVDNLHKWEPPAVLKQYLPYGIIGFDKDGSPIIVCPFYQFDIYGMLHCVTRFEFMRHIVKILEEITQMGYEKSLVHGYKARQVVVIFDVADFNLKQYTWRPAIELVTNMIKQYEQNFPEILKMCYIINAPKIFSVGFNFIKKFLDDYTVSKISINRAGDKWKELAFTHIDPDILPKSFGGNLVENGDERCPSKIVWGGKIPTDLYVEQKDDDDSKSFLETTINKGNKLKLEFDTGAKKEPAEEQILSWDFRTFGYDIKFGIFSIDKASGEKRSEVPLSTVFSNEMDEVGFISTRPNTKYTVVFDNSSSYLRSKKLRYSVSLASESDDITNMEQQVAQTEVASPTD